MALSEVSQRSVIKAFCKRVILVLSVTRIPRVIDVQHPVHVVATLKLHTEKKWVSIRPSMFHKHVPNNYVLN